MPLLERLYLKHNNIGDSGIAALCAACARGALSSLDQLYLEWNLDEEASRRAQQMVLSISPEALDALRACVVAQGRDISIDMTHVHLCGSVGPSLYQLHWAP